MTSSRTALLVGAIALLLWPLLATDYMMVLTNRFMIYCLIVLSFSLLAGQLGLVSLVQTTFSGLAGYSIAILGVRYGIEFPWAPLIALGVVLVTSIAFGLITLRAYRIAFIMLTLALGQMVWALSFQWSSMTQGMDGISNIPVPTLAGLDLSQTREFYAGATILVILAFYAAWRLVNSRYGLLLRGIQENQARMKAFGHPVLRARLLTFVLCALLSGLGGILLAYQVGVISPTSLDIGRAIWVLIAAVVGGYRYLSGVPLGVLLMVTLEAVLNQFTDRHLIVFGTILILVILLMPNGLAPWVEAAWVKIRPRLDWTGKSPGNPLRGGEK
ncbi:branched-chain amino acid ABC transporter permease [Fodinicurvata halophila]